MIVAWPLIGALVGVAGAVVVQVGPGWSASLVHYAALPVLLLAVVGATAPTTRAAGLRATGCFLAFVVAYYAVVAVQFGSVPVLYASAWLAAAVSVCPLSAAAVRWARGRCGLLPAAVAAVGGATALSDGSLGNLLRIAAGHGDAAQARPLLAAVDLAVAAVLVLVLPGGSGTRWAAVLLLVPCAAVATLIGWTVHFGPGPYL